MASEAEGSLAALLTDNMCLNACFSGTRLSGPSLHLQQMAKWICEVFVPAKSVRRSSRLKSAENDIAAGCMRCFPLSGGHPTWNRALVERLVPYTRAGAPAQTLCVWVGGEQAQLLRFLLRKDASARMICTTEDHEEHLILTPLNSRYVRPLLAGRALPDSTMTSHDHIEGWQR